MTKKILKKFLEYLITLFFIITLNFAIPRLMPGDPFTFLSSEEGDIVVTYSEEQIEMYKAYYGMDKPIINQYIDYVGKLFRGDLGYSLYFNASVASIILKRVVWTMAIVIISIILSSILGVLIGCISAYHRNSWIDKVVYSLMIFFSEIPSFLIGILFLFVLAAKCNWFPLSGGMSLYAEYDNSFQKILDILYHAALPILTLTITKIGEFYLLSRNSMISVLSKDYMRTAKAKALDKKRIVFKHALKNAMLPIVTRIFLSMGTLFGGAILVENVFNYPGVGKLMREAVNLRDYSLIQGIFLFVAFMVLLMNFLSDIVYKKLDPRVN